MKIILPNNPRPVMQMAKMSSMVFCLLDVLERAKSVPKKIIKKNVGVFHDQKFITYLMYEGFFEFLKLNS